MTSHACNRPHACSPMPSYPSRMRGACVGLALGLTLSASAMARQPSTSESGGVVAFDMLDDRHECVSEADRAWFLEALRRYERDFGPLSRGDQDDGPVIYRFYPIGATSYRDLLHTHFVDVNPPLGGAYDCGPLTYTEHRGIDSSVRNLIGPQLIGVPVFAAADGVVVATHDGEPDTNACACGGSFPGFPPCPPGTISNSVAIDHGGGRITKCLHLRNGSVSVSVGQQVRAGQQIGLIGSSGCSTGPHLHFESLQDDVVYEPFAGACRPGPSGWSEQEPLNMSMYLRSCAPSRTFPGVSYPTPIPTDRQVLLSDPAVYFRVAFANLPAASTYQVQFIRPDGSLGFTGPVTNLANPYRRVAAIVWSYGVIHAQQIPGTWHIRLHINGQLVIEFPVDAVTEIDPDRNQAPVAVAAALEPSAPSADDTIFCRMTAPLVLDDPDYDLVRYRYQWRVNGQVVRDVVSAGHADAIPRGQACAGSHVECSVTPSDGVLDGPTTLAAATVAGASNGDLNCDGHVDIDDLLTVIASWGDCPSPPAVCSSDLTQDGHVNIDDLLLLIGNWG